MFFFLPGTDRVWDSWSSTSTVKLLSCWKEWEFLVQVTSRCRESDYFWENLDLLHGLHPSRKGTVNVTNGIKRLTETTKKQHKDTTFRCLPYPYTHVPKTTSRLKKKGLK